MTLTKLQAQIVLLAAKGHRVKINGELVWMARKDRKPTKAFLNRVATWTKDDAVEVLGYDTVRKEWYRVCSGHVGSALTWWG
jgi:hypothetical protein